jgi:hypothetical protein
MVNVLSSGSDCCFKNFELASDKVTVAVRGSDLAASLDEPRDLK